MKFFVGIVPPPEIYNQVQSIQNQFGNNRLEPHITVRPPVVPIDLDLWVDAIIQTAVNFKPFTIHLPALGNFGSRVLFISVKSEALMSLYDQLIPALKPLEPEEKKQQSEKYHPHLTLGRAWCGFTKDDFAGMRKLTNDYLSTQPVYFEVNTIRVYHKSDAQKGYQIFRDVPLGS